MRAAAAVVLILLSAAGCDNVSWGGTEVTIVPPPVKAATPATNESPRPVSRGAVELPEGPVLYQVSVLEGDGQLAPVAEITSDSLRALRPGQNASGFADAFIAEHLREGAEFVLFHDGGRVGTFIVQSAAFDGGTPCMPLPSARGILELSAAGQGVAEFLALERQQVPPDVGRASPPEITRSMRVLGPILAERMMRRRGASLPGNWERAYAQVAPFPIEDGTAFAATFLVGDTLGPGLDDQGYSLFFIAEPRGTDYDTTYVSYRPYQDGGKQAPRVIEYLDWDRDGQAELLLRVFGTADSWVEALDRSSRGRWQRTFDDRCTVPRAAGDSAPMLPPTTGDPVVAPDTMSN
jgi:hypothetical protein